MKPVCHVVAGPNGSGKSTFALERIAALIGGRATFGFETTLSGRGHLKLLADARKAGYRICLYYLWMPEKLMLPSRIRHRVLSGGHDVPTVRDGKLAFVTVEEAFSARPDCAERKRADADWRLGNLREQFMAAGIAITPDVWDRLEADRRQALEDDLAWIRRGRKESAL